MIEQPMKVYLYEPKICGFNIAGQRGSKYFNPNHMSVYQKPLNKSTCYTVERRDKCQNSDCKTNQSKVEKTRKTMQPTPSKRD